MYAPYKDRPLNGRELERLRLTLSSFRDGSGQVTLKAGGSMPGFRDYERALAAVLEGTTPEDKGIFDVLIQAEGKPFGISCKMTAMQPPKNLSSFIRWYNKKYGRDIDNREWVKVHLMCGVNTHIVTSVDVSGWEAHDTTYFVPLLEQTARNFHMSEISADKAYLSHKNLAAVETIDATPFVPFKSNTLPTTENSAWGRMYHYSMLNREAFMTHYHRRSNVETVFSMCKAKFGDSVRSKSDSGMVNEVLCKVLCHNICVLIQAIHEFGVEPNFCAQLGLAQKVA